MQWLRGFVVMPPADSLPPATALIAAPRLVAAARGFVGSNVIKLRPVRDAITESTRDRAARNVRG
jgi:hypothetical protein